LKRIAKITEVLNNQVCSTGYCVLKPIKSKLNSVFLYKYLQTDDFIARIEKLQRGASYPAVRDTDVKGMKIPLPKYDEHILIGNYLKTLDQKKSLASSKKQTLTALFKTLLHELMTGQRRVHEIEFEALDAEIKELSTSM
jgi:type I restriction enzyme S subunit